MTPTRPARCAANDFVEKGNRGGGRAYCMVQVPLVVKWRPYRELNPGTQRFRGAGSTTELYGRNGDLKRQKAPVVSRGEELPHNLLLIEENNTYCTKITIRIYN